MGSLIQPLASTLNLLLCKLLLGRADLLVDSIQERLSFLKQQLVQSISWFWIADRWVPSSTGDLAVRSPTFPMSSTLLTTLT